MADPFVAEIRIFPFNFAPKGWAFCDGQLLPISQNTALFSLLGTTYGGNGKSTFGLPDLQGRAPMHPGQGPGLSLRDLGESSGAEAISLLVSEIPLHNHPVSSVPVVLADSNSPEGGSFSRATGAKVYATMQSPVAMNPAAVAVSGGSLPHNNMQPYLTLNFCIAMQGVFPPRQ